MHSNFFQLAYIKGYMVIRFNNYIKSEWKWKTHPYFPQANTKVEDDGLRMLIAIEYKATSTGTKLMNDTMEMIHDLVYESI